MNGMEEFVELFRPVCLAELALVSKKEKQQVLDAIVALWKERFAAISLCARQA